jgi:hypothetical protein
MKKLFLIFGFIVAACAPPAQDKLPSIEELIQRIDGEPSAHNSNG